MLEIEINEKGAPCHFFRQGARAFSRSQHHFQRIVRKEGICVVEKEYVGDGFGLDEIIDIIIKIAWIDDNDFSKILCEKRNHAVCVGIFYKQQFFI